MSEFIKVGAGWKTKSGKGYNCVLEVPMQAGSRFLIFDNKNKKDDRHPDVILGYFDDSEAKRQEERDGIPF